MNLHYWVATGLYAMAAVWVIYHQLRDGRHGGGVVWWLVGAGCLVQGVPMLHGVSGAGGGVVMNLAGSLEWSSWVMGLLYLVGWRLANPETRAASVLLLPLMVLTLGGSLLLSSAAPEVRGVTGPMLIAHLVLSLLAYGLFTIAAVFALMDAFQEHALKSKHLGVLFERLPPLNALEGTLFLMVRMGFLLLTLSIVTGALYSYGQNGIYFVWSHKVLFTWATWMVFGVLLVGRHVQGWRGRKAVRLTLWGYGLLMLAFLGVKFVREIILNINQL
ncbi:MAG: cytochrome c biogenesis protein CcsA [Magnetococcales bacterium]|nr:cytochrome c biogenesis protein CcsA [Magnetococcales bacterium]